MKRPRLIPGDSGPERGQQNGREKHPDEPGSET